MSHKPNETPANVSIFGKSLVIFEILLVFFGGTIVARLLQNMLGITNSKQVIQNITTGNFDTLAVIESLVIRWSLVIALAFLTGGLIGRQSPHDYGLTFAGQSFWRHIRYAFITLAFGFLPIIVLLIGKSVFSLSGGPAQWKIIENAPRTIDFWLFMMASSIVIPPLAEEIFFRGYTQTRLMTAFRPITSILIVALFFTLAHLQYFDGSLVGTFMIPLIIWQVVVIGLSRFYTGSLIPPLIAHAIGNIPMRLPEMAILALFLSAIVIWTLIKYGNLNQLQKSQLMTGLFEGTK